VSVDLRHAAATLRTVDYSQGQRADGAWETLPIPDGMKAMIAVTQPWPTRTAPTSCAPQPAALGSARALDPGV
jgi:hypothetical protein